MFFVSSALMLTGCPQDPQPPTSGTSAPIATVPKVSSALPSAQASSAPEPSPTPAVNVPPLDVPEDVSPVAKSHFERMKELVPKIHLELDAAEKGVATACDISEATCDATWKSVAGNLAKAGNLRRDVPPRCSGSSKDAKRYEASLKAHLAVIDSRLDAIRKRVAAALVDDSQRTKWEGYKANASIPQPCLRYRCDDW